MSLQFIGDAGVYLPEKDAIKITAIDCDSAVDCFVMRSALTAIGCKPTDQAHEIAQKFAARRIDCEIAAMVKFRRATVKVVALELTSADLAEVECFARRLAEASNGHSGFSRTFARALPVTPIV